MRMKLARAVLNSAGGEEEAPFGRNKEGKALLPSPARMRQLGFDPWQDGGTNGVTAGRCLAEQGPGRPKINEAEARMPASKANECV